MGHGICVRLLLAAHAAVNQARRIDATPLYAACNKGHGDCVRLLLTAHAAVDQADRKGATPLIAACIGGHGDIVKLLVHAGARTDLRSAFGTALDLAEAHGHTIIATFLSSRAQRTCDDRCGRSGVECGACGSRAGSRACRCGCAG